MRNYRNLPPLLALALFANALRGTFHFDDYSLFQDPAIFSASGWTAIFRLATTRPLTWLTFWLNYRLAGAEPLSWHVADWAIHAACAALLCRCLVRMIPERTAVFGAAVFAMHPIQTETVAYVFARSTLLATLLCLASLLYWLRGARWMAVFWFGLALLAKEECVFFPCFVALLEWRARRDRREAMRPIGAMLLLAGLAGARVVLATKMIARAGAGFAASVSPLQFATAQGVVIWRYAAELFWPVSVSFDPDLHPSAIAGVAGWLALGALVIYFARRSKMGSACFWCMGALILLLASSSVFPADDLSAERRMYLPMVSLAAAAGVLLDRYWQQRVGRAAIATAFVLLAGCTVYRTEVWKTERALWSDAVAKAPLKARPRIQLARAQSPAEAVEMLDVAARNNPENADVATEQGKVWLQLGHPEKALGAFGRATALAPHEAQNWNNLGVAFAALGQTQAAVAQFRHALALEDCLANARRNLGMAACVEGQR